MKTYIELVHGTSKGHAENITRVPGNVDVS